MKTIICNRIEYVHASEVHYYLLPNIIALRQGKSFRSIDVAEKPEYAQDISDTPSVNLSKETLTLRVERANNSELLQKPYGLYVLKVHTSDGWFMMGTPDNPATFTSQQDVRVATLTFSCKRPL